MERLIIMCFMLRWTILLSCFSRLASLPSAAVMKMKVKWTMLGMVVFFLLSLVMTFCFIWQYRMPKLNIGNIVWDDALKHTHTGV